MVAKDQSGNIVVSDDFSSPAINETIWRTYEFVREISNGKLRSKVRSSSAAADHIYSRLQFTDSSLINAIQAKVTPVTYQNDQNSDDMVARIAGRFYNDGTPGGGIIGDVGAQVRIGGTGINPTASWFVWRETDNDPYNAPETLATGTFENPVTLNNTYTLFLGWDGSKFTFKFDDEEANYPTTSTNPPNSPWMEIGARIWNPSGKEATIEALFDDVQISGSGVPGDVSLDREYYGLSDTAVVTLKDTDLNIDPESRQTVNVRITSTSDTTGITLTLKETGVDSGIFTSTSFGKDLRFTSGASDDVNELIRVANGDTITVIYNDVAPQQMRTATAAIDASPPLTTLIPSRSLYYDGKNYIAPISITYALSATDGLSGVKRIEYNIDGSPFAEYTKPFTLGSAGPHTIRYKALDKAGNWETPKAARHHRR